MTEYPSLKVQKHWNPIFKAQESSGLPVAKFCAKQGIQATSFYSRRKEIRLMSEKKQSGFIRLSNDSEKELQQDNPRPVRIQTPNGYKIEFCMIADEGLDKVLGLLKAL